MSCFQHAWEKESIQALFMEMTYSQPSQLGQPTALLYRYYMIKLSHWYSNHAFLKESDFTNLKMFKINFTEHLKLNYILTTLYRCTSTHCYLTIIHL